MADRRRTFWTMTLWHDQTDMRRYMANGRHRAAMPKLFHWCDEASVVHWTQPDTTLPSWRAADARMRAEGRPSKVRYASTSHASLAYPPPRIAAPVPLNPLRPLA
nr:DUF3291 domain-containing protein [Sphingomonas spermidinifaciens]